jgi:hypothetical protein
MVFDLNAKQCVSTWNSTSQILIEDSKLSISKVWRSLNYYIDPNSDSVVELGTQAHPYKDLASVFLELENYHSNTDRNITIFLKEESNNYIGLNSSRILNITQVKLTTYPENIFTKRATITGVNSIAGYSDHVYPTLFHLIKTQTSDYLFKIFSQITSDREKFVITNTNSVIIIQRWNFIMDSLILKTEYQILDNDFTFLSPAFIESRYFNITNVDADVSGRFFHAYEPSMLNVLNSNFDVYRTSKLFYTLVICNYPDAFLYDKQYINNVTMYYSKPDQRVPMIGPLFLYLGVGSVDMSNVRWRAYSLASEVRAFAVFTMDSHWNKETGRVIQVNVKNITIDLQGILPPGVGVMMPTYFDYQDQINPNGANIQLDNFNISNIQNNAYPLIGAALGHLANWTLTNIQINNILSFSQFIFVTIVDNMYYENITINNAIAGNDKLIEHYVAHKLVIKNLIIDGLYFTPGNNLLDAIIIPVIYDVYFSNFKFTNSYLKNTNLLKISSFGSGQISMINFEFVNVTLGGNTKLIVQSLLRYGQMKNFTFNNVKATNNDDITNLMIGMTAVQLPNNSFVEIDNITVENSSVQLIEISNTNQASTSNQTLSFNNLKYKDCEVDTEMDLVKFNDLQSISGFAVIMQNVSFTNISMANSGNLMAIKSQVKLGMTVKDVAVDSIYNAGILIQSLK